MGGAFSIPVFDLFHQSGINVANQASHTVDGLHFNTVGHVHIIPMVGKAMDLL